MAEPHSRAAYQAGDPRLIMRWARRYAKSRTISFLVQWLVIVVMVVVIGVGASLTSIAYEQGYTALLSLSMLLMCASIGVLAWFSVSSWGSEIIWKVTNWLYGREGYASYSGDHGERPTPLWITGLGGGLVIYHLVLAMLVSFGVIYVSSMQPYSAIYMTPFLMIMVRQQDLGFWAWLWPILYGLHAILIVTGVLPVLRGNWVLLNMIGPVFGYGLVAIVVGHFYSRYALYNLKRLARAGLPQDTGSKGDAGV